MTGEPQPKSTIDGHGRDKGEAMEVPFVIAMACATGRPDRRSCPPFQPLGHACYAKIDAPPRQLSESDRLYRHDLISDRSCARAGTVLGQAVAFRKIKPFQCVVQAA